MAIQEHLDRLKHGVEAWNAWRDEIAEGTEVVVPDLRRVNLSGADLQGANFDRTFLIGADLSGANLAGASLVRAFLIDTDLNKANLTRANLSSANLNGANLSRANLKQANLNRAKLNAANLTGACIQDWSINARTRLGDVACEYIFLEGGANEAEWSNRLPADLDKTFAIGEFTRLFTVDKDSIEVSFQDSLNWQALAYAFNETNARVAEASGQEMYFCKYEVVEDNILHIEISTPPKADKQAIQDELMHSYDRYRQQLEVGGEGQTGQGTDLKTDQTVLYRFLNPGLAVRS